LKLFNSAVGQWCFGRDEPTTRLCYTNRAEVVLPLSPDEFSLWPPVGEITENTEDDWQSNTRPIDFIDSPRCHLSPVKFKHALCKVYADHGDFELLSNLVFKACRSCGDLVWVGGFNSVFERDAGDDFGEVVKAA
jgi:hypothetical protein